jgi:pyridoxal phosphate enzyme (YggS family)
VSVADNVRRIQERIAEACRPAGRKPEQVRLIAVSKTVEPARVIEAVQAGIADLGENWVQEAVEKHPLVTAVVERRARWHMIGHLQTNKVRKALSIFDVVQSLDSNRLAEELSRRAEQVGRRVGVLIEVNTSGEESKFGVTPDAADALVRSALRLDGLRLEGLMTIGPGLSVEEPERSRPCFRLLRELRDRLEQEHHISLPQLSMGMSSDFVVAIQEGATMLRIGTAIFGARETGHRFTPLDADGNKGDSRESARPVAKPATALSADEFARLVDESVRQLPAEFRAKIEQANITFEVQDRPEPEEARRVGAGRNELLGLYHGVPLGKRSVWQNRADPDRIIIYRRNVEAVVRSADEVRSLVREVVMHEIGHYFGLSEDELRAAME